MIKIADTGLLKALLDRSDEHHSWASDQFRAHAPFHTCEPVLDELAFLVANPRLGVKLVARGDLILDFQLADNIPAVLELLEKYADRPIDLADACIVRMTELHDRCKVWTTDARDFKIFRRHRRHPIPVETP
jgi:uncharacterized protein